MSTVKRPFEVNEYRTGKKNIGMIARTLPSMVFYSKFIGIVLSASSKAKKGNYGYQPWIQSSLDVQDALESVGVSLHVSGIKNLRALDGPCVFIGNHMSMLETVVLPGIIQPLMNVTFVVKESLLTYPVFGHVMRSRDPIAVTRTNPRQDLKAVMEGGKSRLKKGISIIVFPQTTRTASFERDKFNSIGVKLAQRSGVQVVPLALKTDAWSNGKLLKDFGGIDRSKEVHIAFGKPLSIQKKGAEEHQIIMDFIEDKLASWA